MPTVETANGEVLKDLSKIYYSKEMIDNLHQIFDNISPSTLHKIMNPMCGECLAERGRALIEGRASWRDRLSDNSPTPRS